MKMGGRHQNGEIGWGGDWDWNDLAQDTGMLHAVVNTVMKLRVP